MDKLDTILQQLQTIASLQIVITIETLAFMFVDSYIEHNPLPPETSPEHLKAIQCEMIAIIIAHAMNNSANLLLNKSALQDNAADIASAAIAKAADKLH